MYTFKMAFFFFFFFFFGLHLLHMDVFRLGVESKPQQLPGLEPHLQPTPQLTAMLDP